MKISNKTLIDNIQKISCVQHSENKNIHMFYTIAEFKPVIKFIIKRIKTDKSIWILRSSNYNFTEQELSVILKLITRLNNQSKMIYMIKNKKRRNNMKNFNDVSWESFIKSIRKGTVQNHFKVGDKRSVLLNNGERITIAIADFNHDVDVNGNVLPVTLTFVDTLAQKLPMNETLTNKGGWELSCMRKSMKKILKLIPIEIQNSIVACKKDNKTIDRLFLPSEVEVWGKNYFGEDDPSNKQYEFYKNKYNRIKFSTDNDIYSNWWWLRSPRAGYASYFCRVISDGNCSYGNAYNSFGVAPCFAIA